MAKSKNIFGVISILLSLGIMLFFVFATKGLEKLHEALGVIKYRWLVGAAICMIIYVVFEALVLLIITRKVKKGYGFLRSLKSSIIGLYYSALTPFASGGQPMQLYSMMKDGVDAASGGAILTIKAIIYQTSMTIYAVISIIIFHSFFDENIPKFDIIAIVGLIVNVTIVFTVSLVMIKESITKRLIESIIGMLNKIGIVKKKDEIINKAYEQIYIYHMGAAKFNRSKKTILIAVILTFIQFTAFFLVSFFIYKGFDIGNIRFVYFIAAQSILTMIASFMPTPGGSGATEGGYYVIFSLFFIRATIVPALLLWRFITYYSLVIIGAIVSFVFNGSSEKQLEDTEHNITQIEKDIEIKMIEKEIEAEEVKSSVDL